jgi:hypothetical protein
MGYGLEGPDLIFGCVTSFFFFSAASRLILRPTQPPVQWVLGTFPEKIKQSGCVADHSTPTSVEVNKNGGMPPLPAHVFME